MVNTVATTRNLSDVIWSEGVLVRVFMGAWSMQAKLDKADVGLEDISPELIKLGHKRLFPKTEANKFANIRTKVSQLLTVRGRRFYPFLDGAFFVRYEVLNDVLEKLQKFQVEYMEFADKFINHYDTLRESWLEEYPNFAEKLAPYYPEPDKVRSKFKFGFFVTKIREVVDDVDYVSGHTITDADYANWLEESINDLRGEITVKVKEVQKTIEEGKIDNRVKTRVNKIRDQLIALDMTKDEVLKEALEDLAKDPTVANVKKVVVQAKPLKSRQVRKLFLD